MGTRGFFSRAAGWFFVGRRQIFGRPKPRPKPETAHKNSDTQSTIFLKQRVAEGKMHMQFAFYTKTEGLAQLAKRYFIISDVLRIRSLAWPIPWVLK